MRLIFNLAGDIFWDEGKDKICFVMFVKLSLILSLFSISMFSGCEEGLGQLPLMERDLRNGIYNCEWAQNNPFRLNDGVYREKYEVVSASEVVIKLSDLFVFGDLNDDGVYEAAAVLIINAGGSGTFFELVVITKEDGLAKQVCSVGLGDRIKIKSLATVEGVILVDMITQGAEDSMPKPTLEVIRKFQLVGDKLMQISE